MIRQSIARVYFDLCNFMEWGFIKCNSLINCKQNNAVFLEKIEPGIWDSSKQIIILLHNRVQVILHKKYYGYKKG